MVTEVTSTSFKIDDELVDLTSLYTRAQLLGDGKSIHYANGIVGYLYNAHILLRKGDQWPNENEEKILSYLMKLRAALHQGGV